MRLWLDDERDPKDPSIQEDFGAKGDEVWVKTVEEAIEHLKTGLVTSISLDFDLGVSHRNGMFAAQWILEETKNNGFKKIEWNAHTSNRWAAVEMSRVLVQAEKIWASS